MVSENSEAELEAENNDDRDNGAENGEKTSEVKAKEKYLAENKGVVKERGENPDENEAKVEFPVGSEAVVNENGGKTENNGRNEEVPSENEDAVKENGEKTENGALKADTMDGESSTVKEDSSEKIPMKWMLSQRPTSMMKTKLLVKDVAKFIKETKKQIALEDLELRVIPSPAACRFELPIDMALLEGLIPLAYVSKYCKISESRKVIYIERYNSFTQGKEDNFVSSSQLQEAYEKIFQESTLSDETLHLIRLLDMDLNEGLNVDQFAVVSCLMERIIISNKGCSSPEESLRNPFEVADFCSLNGKLHDINVSPVLRNLLEFIRCT